MCIRDRFLNDLRLNDNATSLAEALTSAGYNTGYIGKWHIDGTGRSAYIPPERRQGFDYWKVLECTHNYNKSRYFDREGQDPRTWEGYDAYAQTRDAVTYIRNHGAATAENRKPFSLFLSWGPPHAPYRTGPTKWLEHYDRKKLTLRENVPAQIRKQAQLTYAGYYAHCSALDECVGWLMTALRETGQLENTIVVYTSDHGDMQMEHRQFYKMVPRDPSASVPMVIFDGRAGRTLSAPQRMQFFLPLKLGGCGFQSAVWRRASLVGLFVFLTGCSVLTGIKCVVFSFVDDAEETRTAPFLALVLPLASGLKPGSASSLRTFSASDAKGVPRGRPVQVWTAPRTLARFCKRPYFF